MTETARAPKVTCDMTMSLDGFTSGPEHLDQGFMSIQDWAHQAMAFRERFGFEATVRPFSASLATVEIVPKGDGTRLTYTEQGAYFDGADKPAAREEGWQALLEALGAELRRPH